MSTKSRFSLSNWLNSFFSKEGSNFVYSLVDTSLAGGLSSVFNGAYNEMNMVKLFETIPEFMFVVNAVASRVKNGVYILVKDSDGTEVTDNKLWNQMVKEGPNWQYKFDEFVWHAVVNRLITGNRYGYSYCPGVTTGVAPKHSNIKQVRLLAPQFVMIMLKNPRPALIMTTKAGDYVDHYTCNDGDLNGPISPEYVVHDLYMSMGNIREKVTGKGISPFIAGEYPLSNLVAVYSARNVIYVKRGPGGMIVAATSDKGGAVALAPHEKEEVIEDMTRKYGGGAGQTPFAISSYPIDFKKTGATIAELEPFKETEASAAALCGLVGCPTSLMPKAGEAKFANLDISERNFYENTIFAEAESICKFLTAIGHFGEVGCHVVVSFDHISALQDDALKSAQAFSYNVEGAESAFAGGHITENEYRSIIGHEPVEGGDNYIQTEEGGEPLEEEATAKGQVKTVRLPAAAVDLLINLQESGKGYHIADVVLKNKLVLKSRVIFGSSYLKLRPGEVIREEDIDTIAQAQKRKGVVKLYGNKNRRPKKKNYFHHD